MLLANVEGFLEVARPGNLRRAAEALHLSQPALTGRIQALEAELGATLFRRGRIGMALTAAGRALVPYAERALDALRGGAALLRDVERGVAGELAIGTAAAVSAYVLPELLVRFAATHPGIRLLVWTGHSGGDRRSGRPGRSRARAGPRAARPARREPAALRRRARPRRPARPSLRRAGSDRRRLGVALLPGTAVADALGMGSLVRIALLVADPIRRRIVAVERPQAGEPSAALAAFRELLGRIPELVPGARSVAREE